jgi:hypothetical protein
MAIQDLNPRDIELSVTSSRSTLELGEPWEILLHIKNHSDQTVWIAAAATTLTLPAEVIHPAESRVASRGAQLPTISGPGYDLVNIPKGGRYICTWRLNENAKELARISSPWDLRRWHLFFHPGEYEIQANIHLWTEQPNARELVASRLLGGEDDAGQGLAALLGTLKSRKEEKGELTATGSAEKAADGSEEDDTETKQQKLFEAKEKQFQVLSKSIPLTVIGRIDVTIKSTSQFGAAAFGGGLAFLFREFYAMTEATVVLTWSDLALLPTYVLSAILISLFVNRITEARFPLTVKIMDFWGATAFGVLAAFGGDAILAQILKFLT